MGGDGVDAVVGGMVWWCGWCLWMGGGGGGVLKVSVVAYFEKCLMFAV